MVVPTVSAYIQNFTDSLHGDHFDPGFLPFFGHVGLRYDGAFETVFGGFLQSLLSVRHRSDFTGEALNRVAELDAIVAYLLLVHDYA